jgi:hypothetical protein
VTKSQVALTLAVTVKFPVFAAWTANDAPARLATIAKARVLLEAFLIEVIFKSSK